MVRGTCVRLLQGAGYDVVSADDGESGWDVLKEGGFALLLTDNEMPRLSGLGLIERVRSAGCAIPVILVSGVLPWDEQGIPALLLPLSVLAKPFSFDELLGLIRRALAQMGVRRPRSAALATTVAGSNGGNGGGPPMFDVAANARARRAALDAWEGEGGQGAPGPRIRDLAGTPGARTTPR